MHIFRALVIITAFSLAAASSSAAQGRSGAHKPTVPAQAQAGKGAQNGAKANNPAGRADTARSPKAVRNDESRSITTNIAKNPQLEARLKAMLPSGMTLDEAAKGFRNQGQFIAALEASKNRNIPFVDLKKEMTGPNELSLGQAIQKLQPENQASK
jgi:hypothetical protein